MASNTKPISKQALSTLEALGQTISASRRARKWKQAELASMSNVGMNTMVAIEKGSPRVLMESYLSVLDSLGLLDILRRAANLGADQVAVENLAELLPKRVVG